MRFKYFRLFIGQIPRRNLTQFLIFLLVCLITISLLHLFHGAEVIHPFRLLNCLSSFPTNRPISGDTCCPKIDTSSLLLRPDFYSSPPSYADILRRYSEVCLGGWQPTLCRAQQNVAILVPYRNRPNNLRFLLDRLHTLLPLQLVAYSIYVIEQFGPNSSNRGLLLNIGIKEALTDDPSIDCFVFHDMDLIPENLANLYVCDNTLRHLASGVDEFRYHVPFDNYAGGVSSLSKKNVFKVGLDVRWWTLDTAVKKLGLEIDVLRNFSKAMAINSFPNRYWGWGNEDDELAARCHFHDIRLTLPPTQIGRYHATRHRKASRGSGHYNSSLRLRGYHNDGLSLLTKLSGSAFTLVSHSHTTRLREEVQTEQEKPSAVDNDNKPGIDYSQFLGSTADCMKATAAYMHRQSLKSKQVLSTIDKHLLVNTTAGISLYRHLVVLPSAEILKPNQPSEETRESSV